MGDLINSKYPQNDVKEGLQAETKNPIDFPMHPNRGMPAIEVNVSRTGVEGTTSPNSGRLSQAAQGTQDLKEDAQAAANRAMKQRMAGL